MLSNRFAISSELGVQHIVRKLIEAMQNDSISFLMILERIDYNNYRKTHNE